MCAILFLISVAVALLTFGDCKTASVKSQGILWCGRGNGFAKNVPVQLHYFNNTDSWNEVVIATGETNRRGQFKLEANVKYDSFLPAIYFQADVNGRYCNGDALCIQILNVEVPSALVRKPNAIFDLGIWNLQIRHAELNEMCAKRPEVWPAFLHCIVTRFAADHTYMDMASFYTDATKHWAPKCVEELNNCTSLYNDIAPEFDPTHPGFNDEAYKKRRHEVTSLATQCKIGDQIPLVDYTKEEIELWDKVYGGLREHHPKYASKEYLDGIQDLEKQGLMGFGFVPQVAKLSEYLKNQTGFQLRPIGGFVEPRDFLAHLAFRYFPCTQYMRHPQNVFYSPDPDGIHDMVGHVPMFLNPELADLSQKIGQISMGASETVIKKLTNLYWFTVEVGLTRENMFPKIYGAAVLSSVSEMEYALGNSTPIKPFNATSVCDQNFDPTKHQEIYFVTDSIAEAMDQVSEFGYNVRGIRKEFEKKLDEEK